MLPCHTEFPPAGEAGSEVSQYDSHCGQRVFFFVNYSLKLTAMASR